VFHTNSNIQIPEILLYGDLYGRTQSTKQYINQMEDRELMKPRVPQKKYILTRVQTRQRKNITAVL
jgi:hypothetical protein